MNDKLGLYKILEVPHDATFEQIKTAYRKLAVILHPDKNRNDKNAEEKFKKLGYAYSVLSDPDERAHYDTIVKILNSGHEEGEPNNTPISKSFMIICVFMFLMFPIIPDGEVFIMWFLLFIFFLTCLLLNILGLAFDNFIKETYVRIVNNYPKTKRIIEKTTKIIKTLLKKLVSIVFSTLLVFVFVLFLLSLFVDCRNSGSGYFPSFEVRVCNEISQ